MTDDVVVMRLPGVVVIHDQRNQTVTVQPSLPALGVARQLTAEQFAALLRPLITPHEKGNK